MVGVLLDTDVVIDFLRGQRVAVRFIKDHAEEIHLSVITVAELFSGVKGDDEGQELAQLLKIFPIVDITMDIARMAGEWRQKYGPSHGIGLPDCLIAATAKRHRLTLQTLNTRHFPMFAKLRPPYQK